MAGKNEDSNPKGVLTRDGLYRANNFILDLLRPDKNKQSGYRKDVVTFIRDEKTGHIKEMVTGKECEVQYLKK